MDENSWFEELLASARERHPSVTEAVASRIKSWSTGDLGEHLLSPAQLNEFARRLIVDMEPPQQAEDLK